ncbi:MAG: hypothetical protein J6Y91_00480, partial [Alphaproteobacteria bacterium]|nr:hypothetical protein [Alphaproteobacteria bacterium]
ILILAICAFGYYVRFEKVDLYILSTAALFVFEMYLRLFFNATYLHYLSTSVLFSAMLAAPFIGRLMEENRLSLYVFATISVLHIIVNCYLSANANLFPEKYLQKTAGVSVTSAFYAPRLSYYWMYPMLESIDDILFRRVDNYDINRLYLEASPQTIIVDPNSTIEGISGIIQPLNLDDAQQKIIKKHAVDIKAIGNYIEIEEAVYQRTDTGRK